MTRPCWSCASPFPVPCSGGHAGRLPCDTTGVALASKTRARRASRAGPFLSSVPTGPWAREREGATMLLLKGLLIVLGTGLGLFPLALLNELFRAAMPSVEPTAPAPSTQKAVARR